VSVSAKYWRESQNKNHVPCSNKLHTNIMCVIVYLESWNSSTNSIAILFQYYTNNKETGNVYTNCQFSIYSYPDMKNHVQWQSCHTMTSDFLQSFWKSNGVFNGTDWAEHVQLISLVEISFKILIYDSTSTEYYLVTQLNLIYYLEVISYVRKYF